MRARLSLSSVKKDKTCKVFLKMSDNYLKDAMQ